MSEIQASHLGLQRMLQALFDNLPASLYAIDRDYRITAVNPARARSAGETTPALTGQICYQALFHRTQPCEGCRIAETFSAGLHTRRTARRMRRAEEPVEWEIRSFPVFDEGGQVSQAFLYEQDVTDQRRLEGLLVQSEKLAAIGQLSAGLAHEINNPLTAIVANAQLLRRGLPPGDDLQESVDLITQAGARATQMVRNLLDFARKEEYQLELTDVNETVQRALALVQHEISARSIQLVYIPGENIPLILASQDHLQGVWLNLLMNALDSMDKEPASLRVSTQRIGREIRVNVCDNGRGIPAENIMRIFEPFYTTKAAGHGTGLGLAVSHRIVKQHGGNILVNSVTGDGSEFIVILPVLN